MRSRGVIFGSGMMRRVNDCCTVASCCLILLGCPSRRRRGLQKSDGSRRWIDVTQLRAGQEGARGEWGGGGFDWQTRREKRQAKEAQSTTRSTRKRARPARLGRYHGHEWDDWRDANWQVSNLSAWLVVPVHGSMICMIPDWMETSLNHDINTGPSLQRWGRNLKGVRAKPTPDPWVLARFRAEIHCSSRS